MDDDEASGMRRHPLIGSKLWFRPRRMAGWGWEPASWEGAVVSLLGGAAIFVPIFLTGGERTLDYFLWVVGVVVVLLLTCVLKGTPPGGASEYREFIADHDREP